MIISTGKARIEKGVVDKRILFNEIFKTGQSRYITEAILEEINSIELYTDLFNI